MTPLRVLYCNCTYANVVPREVKAEVLRQLDAAGVSYDAVADLCELSARKDPALAQLARAACDGTLRIAACYPRAVRWLFAGAGAPLPETGVEIANMRTDTAEQVATAVLRPDSTATPEAS